MSPSLRLLLVLTAIVVGLAGAGAGTSAAGAPHLVAPRAGATVQEMPVFAWAALRGADHYEFQLAADPRFNSIVKSGSLTTANTRASLTAQVDNGTYWWRVRGASKSGQASAWSAARAVRKAWSTQPRILAPANGASINFPATPLTLRWVPVPHATDYLVTIAAAPDLGSPLTTRPIKTAATALTPDLTPGSSRKTYYWAVTPVDATGNKGKPSTVARFDWLWPSKTAVTLADLQPVTGTQDPQYPEFSWKPIPGAARYELDVNTSPDFAPGSRICCKKPILGTVYAPTQVLPDNTYYWRVRAIDLRGNAGEWNAAPEFQKVFDKAASLGRPAISNLRLRDYASNLSPGATTSTPIIVWDPVPGASQYFVQVAPVMNGRCNWQATKLTTQSFALGWEGNVPNSAWTPLAKIGSRVRPPYPSSVRVRAESSLLAGAKCARVRAVSSRDASNRDVYGDFTYLGCPASARACDTSPGFVYAGPPCPTSCGGAEFLGGGDYGVTNLGSLPCSAQGKVCTTTTPLLTWRPSAGGTWWVLISKDPDFHTLVDYAFVNEPAYAPRTTVSDETTGLPYYWVAIPAKNVPQSAKSLDQQWVGDQASGDPGGATPSTFVKHSVPPVLVGPSPNARVALAPVFQWKGVDGTLHYHLQVSRDSDFGSVLADVVTDSLAYASETTYPADVALYWRVRAEDVNKIGLVWSETRKFQSQLPSPSGLRTQAAKTPTLIPTMTWQPVSGAVSYDFHVDYERQDRDFRGLPSPAFTATKYTGTGPLSWKVRANFPFGSHGALPSAWSKPTRYTRTIPAPAGLRVLGGGTSLVLQWLPELGAKTYRVEISPTSDFSRARRYSTDLSSFAPILRTTRIMRGGSGWTKARRFHLTASL
jgi:hypothetical protein